MLGRNQRLRKSFFVAFLLAMLLSPGAWASIQKGEAVRRPTVRARAAVLMDAETGELLYARRPDERLPPASTTKVMTALLAIDSGRLAENVPVSAVAARAQPTKINLRAGDRVRLTDLTYAVLLRSANDASVVVAEAVGGSVAGFAKKMNARAAEMGARNTTFVNPNGLPAQGHYSTARDLALIMRHAIDNPKFREIAGSTSARLKARHGTHQRTIDLRNRNRFLRGYRVPVIGKTGYTRAAKRCFVGAADLGGRKVIVAFLGSTDLWGDARRLLDYGLARVEADQAPRTQTVALASPSPQPKKPSTAAVGPEVTRESRGLSTGAPSEYSLLLTPAHNSRGAAERLRHFVDRRGHRAVIEAVGSMRTRQYRVRVVGLHSLDAALQAGAALREEHLHPTIVPPS